MTADVAATKVVIYAILLSEVFFREVSVHCDSRTAILVSSLFTMRSKFVKHCLTSLSIASSYFIIRLGWIPGHTESAGNCRDEKGYPVPDNIGL